MGADVARRQALWHTTFLPVQPGSSADTVSPPLESPISARDLMDVVISRRVARSYLKGQDTHTHKLERGHPRDQGAVSPHIEGSPLGIDGQS